MTRADMVRYLRASVRGLLPELAEEAVQEGLMKHFESTGTWCPEADLGPIKGPALTAARRFLRAERGQDRLRRGA